MNSSRGLKLFCSLFIAVGLITVGVGVRLLIKSTRSENWPVIDGIVQSAKMTSHSDSDGSTYSADVTYSYQVAGKSYTGRTIAIGQMSSSAEYARGVLNRYPVGKKTAVHYLPGDPSDAVLETGIHGGMWICFAVGTGFTFFGILFLQLSRSATRAQKPDDRVTMEKPPVRTLSR